LIYFVSRLVDLGTARTTPLPDRKALEMILEKLQKCVFHIFVANARWDLLRQVLMSSISPPFATVLFRRKDTYGVFAEPVDPEEVKSPYSFAMLPGVANLFGRELLSIDIAFIV